MFQLGINKLDALPNLYAQYITAYEVCKVQVDKQMTSFGKLFAGSSASGSQATICNTFFYD